jgi:hypothetical protein
VRRLDDDVDLLLSLIEHLNPDPTDVDRFENNLARNLGLRRHPACPESAWVRHRVRFLVAHHPRPTGADSSCRRR